MYVMPTCGAADITLSLLSQVRINYLLHHCMACSTDMWQTTTMTQIHHIFTW